MICPKCGSNEVNKEEFINSNTTTTTKGFGCIKACLGFLIFNIPGILCGLCGMGKSRTTTTSTSKVIHICQNCGKKF